MPDKRATVAISHTNDKHRSQQRVEALVREVIDPLGDSYKELINQWRDILPTESLGLSITY